MSTTNKPEILTPQNSVLLLIDYQPQMAFGSFVLIDKPLKTMLWH